MFYTELHCHSSDVSSCSRINAKELCERYIEAGYNTVTLTNHFNRHTYGFVGANGWEDWIEKYVGAYEKLKKEATGRLNILLGMEICFDGARNDYLVLGITKEFLLSLKDKDVFSMSPADFHPIAKQNGVLFIQAHPFRFGMNVTNPENLDGVEVFNGHKGHNSNNDIANAWAQKYSLIKTSGTDLHYTDFPINAGIITENEIKSEKQLVEILKSGKYSLINPNLI